MQETASVLAILTIWLSFRRIVPVSEVVVTVPSVFTVAVVPDEILVTF